MSLTRMRRCLPKPKRMAKNCTGAASDGQPALSARAAGRGHPENASPRRSIGPANGVEVDGWVLPQPPAEVFATGHEHRVPLLRGIMLVNERHPDYR